MNDVLKTLGILAFTALVFFGVFKWMTYCNAQCEAEFQEWRKIEAWADQKEKECRDRGGIPIKRYMCASPMEEK